jgi:hypothetical protein
MAMLSYVIRPAFRMTCIRYLAALFTHPTVSYLSLTNFVGGGGNNCTSILLVPLEERGKWAHAPLGNGGVQVLRVLLANGQNRLGGRRKGARVVSVYLCSFVAPMWRHHRHHIMDMDHTGVGLYVLYVSPRTVLMSCFRDQGFPLTKLSMWVMWACVLTSFHTAR